MEYQKLLSSFLDEHDLILSEEYTNLFLTNDEDIEYPCSPYTKSSHFHFLHKLMMYIPNVTLEKFLYYIINDIPVEDINIKNKKGWTPLMIVCRKSLPITKMLLEHNADIHSSEENGFNVLHLVSHSYDGDLSIIDLFIEYGLDINLKTVCGYVPLICACQNVGNTVSIEMIEKLINMNADVNVKCINDYTPLTYTALFSTRTITIDVMKLLLKNGANINYIDKYGFDILMNCCNYINKFNIPYEIFEFIIKNGANVNNVSNKDNSALHFLIANKTHNLEIVELILMNGLDPNIQNINGHSVLMAHLEKINKYNDTYILELLLKYGSDVNLKTKFDKSCIELLFNKDLSIDFMLKIIKLLVMYGVDFKKVIINGENFIHFVHDEYKSIVINIIEHSLFINIRKKYESKKSECIICSKDIICIICSYNHSTCYHCLDKWNYQCHGCQLFLS